MIRAWIKVAAIDALLLVLVYFVGADVQNRMNCALGSPLYGEGCLARSSPDFSYSALTRFFSMVRDGVVLSAPPTLDWVQLLLAVFALVNAWFVYTLVTERRRAQAGASLPQPKPAEH